MADPARKIEPDIKPNIRPDLHVIDGGGQTSSNRADLNDLNKRESNPDEVNNDDSVKDREEKGSWQDKTTPERSSTDANGKKNVVAKKGKLSFLKKKGPLGLILTAVVGGGGMMTMLFSPGLLIIQIKEVMVDKFNAQLTSMDIRTTKVLKSKTFSSAGICGTKISINCKFHSMSDKQISRLKKAGFDIESEGTTVIGRNKVKSISYDGVEYKSASKFSSQLSSDVKLRSALKKGYSPLFASFADKIWNKALFKIKITEGKIKITGTKEEEKLKSIQDDVSSGEKITINEKVPPDASKYPGGESDPDYIKEKENYDNWAKNKDATEKILQEAKESADNVAKGGEKAAAAALKITGVVDNVCTVYNTMRAVGFAAKAVRAIQLARFAFLFLKIADQIKADGNPDPEDVSYLGKILTTDVISTVTTAAVTKKVFKSATDSFGYKYAAYGDKGIMPDTAAMFLAGGGLTGTLINITSIFKQFLTVGGKNPDDVCRINNNTYVQLGIGAASLILAIASGGATFTLGAVLQGAAAIAMGIAVSFLPALLKDILAGTLVDKNTVGELAGDAITSGASGLQGTSASFTNAPLTVPQAEAYQELSNKVAAEYAEEDRLAYSPFDISNKNTFLGSIRFAVLPYLTDTSSILNSVQSIASVAINSLSIANQVSAASKASYSYSGYCTDVDYNNLGLATDPYCNIAYGIPTNDLDISVDDVLSHMQTQIDDETGATVSGSNYETFKSSCVERPVPIGYTGPNNEYTSGEECIIGSAANLSKPEYADYKYYYLYTIDSRVESGMDGDDEDLNEALKSNLQSDISFYTPSLDDSDVATSEQTDYSEMMDSIDATTETSTEEIINNVINKEPVEAQECSISDNYQIGDSLNILCGYTYPGVTRKGSLSL